MTRRDLLPVPAATIHGDVKPEAGLHAEETTDSPLFPVKSTRA